MENSIKIQYPNWNTYSGQDLSAAAANHLFKIKISTFLNEISSFHLILSEQEITRASRFLKQEDKENYLVRKYALRMVLSKFLQHPPAEIQYQQTANKKPAINNLHFNTSHTKGYAIISISTESTGTDIEYLNPDFDYSNLLPLCFSAEESRFISLGDAMQQNFYILWTRKEALIKATGEGLNENLAVIPSLHAYPERKGQLFEVTTFKNDDLLISTAFISNIKELMLWEYLPSSYPF